MNTKRRTKFAGATTVKVALLVFGLVDGVAGIICGRALYDGRLDLGQALALLQG